MPYSFIPLYSQDLTQASELWALREHIPLAASDAPYQYKYDVSLPLQHFCSLVTHTRQRLAHAQLDSIATACGYGHLGEYDKHS